MNQELFRKNLGMLMICMTFFMLMAGVIAQFHPRTYVYGLISGIFMGMAALSIGFQVSPRQTRP